MMDNLMHLEIFPEAQKQIWDLLVSSNALQNSTFYLAGGTALVLQLGHRQSVDFDFFSTIGTQLEAKRVLESCNLPYSIRDQDVQTLHAEVQGVKLSFIGGYSYQVTSAVQQVGAVSLASVADVAAMKCMAITNRATERDYIDIAAIIKSGRSLGQIFDVCKVKFGIDYNIMLPLRALTLFDDLDNDSPTMLDVDLQNNWKNILRASVRMFR